jgi:hypothetical protein
VYAELNASWPLRERFTLIGHLGLLHPSHLVQHAHFDEVETGQGDRMSYHLEGAVMVVTDA